jgi:hypothetical protein
MRAGVAKALYRLFMTAELHSSAINTLTGAQREQAAEVPSQNRPYKATVVIFFNGGTDRSVDLEFFFCRVSFFFIVAFF